MAINPKLAETILKDSVELLINKNADYSSDNIRVEGSRGVAVRLVDKVARLRNLLSKPYSTARFESILDTFRDITNYGVIGQLLETGGWGRDIESVSILGSRLTTPAEQVGRIEDVLHASGVVFSWASDVWRYSGTTPHPTARRRVYESLLETSDAVLVVGTITPEWARLVEWNSARGGRTLVVGNSAGFEDCEVFPTLEEALDFIVSAGLGAKC